MDTEATRAAVRVLYDAYSQRDFDRVAELIHDDIDWIIYGPVQIFPFEGQHQGKAEVLAVLGDIAKNFLLERYVPEIVVVEGDRAAVMSNVAFVQRETGRTLSFRIADVLRLRDGKVIEFREFAETFDLVERHWASSSRCKARRPALACGRRRPARPSLSCTRPSAKATTNGWSSSITMMWIGCSMRRGQYSPHVGVRHGKIAAFQTLTAINELFRFARHVTELVIADGERAAALADCTLVQRATGRNIRCRVASFYRFRDGRAIGYRGFTVSFDVAEQVLGRHIDV